MEEITRLLQTHKLDILKGPTSEEGEGGEKR